MAGGFEEFLNLAIPLVLIISGIAFVWWKAKEPLTALFNWLIGLFQQGGDKAVSVSKEIVYDI